MPTFPLRAFALAALIVGSLAPGSAARDAPAAAEPVALPPLVATWTEAVFSRPLEAPQPVPTVDVSWQEPSNVTVRLMDVTEPVAGTWMVTNATLAPGASGVYTVEVQNPAADAVTVVPTLRVRSADWASPVPLVEADAPPAEPPAPGVTLDAHPLRLEPGARRVLTFDVAVPEDAAPGWTLRLALEGRMDGRPDAVPLAPDLVLHVEPPKPPPAVGAMTAERVTLLESLGLALALTGAAATAAWAAVARRDDLKALALAPLLGLFTRLGRQDVLSHATRDRLVGLVRDRPGVTYSELRAATGLATGVLTHHLGVLEQHRVLASRREGRNRRYYVAGTRLPDAAPSPVAGVQARVLELLATGRLSQSAIARRLGVTQQAVSYHARALARKGLLPAAPRS